MARERKKKTGPTVSIDELFWYLDGLCQRITEPAAMAEFDNALKVAMNYALSRGEMFSDAQRTLSKLRRMAKKAGGHRDVPTWPEFIASTGFERRTVERWVRCFRGKDGKRAKQVIADPKGSLTKLEAAICLDQKLPHTDPDEPPEIQAIAERAADREAAEKAGVDRLARTFRNIVKGWSDYEREWLESDSDLDTLLLGYREEIGPLMPAWCELRALGFAPNKEERAAFGQAVAERFGRRLDTLTVYQLRKVREWIAGYHPNDDTGRRHGLRRTYLTAIDNALALKRDPALHRESDHDPEGDSA